MKYILLMTAVLLISGCQQISELDPDDLAAAVTRLYQVLSKF